MSDDPSQLRQRRSGPMMYCIKLDRPFYLVSSTGYREIIGKEIYDYANFPWRCDKPTVFYIDSNGGAINSQLIKTLASSGRVDLTMKPPVSEVYYE